MKKDNYLVELVEPCGEESDAYAYYNKIHNGPYHICYKVDNIDDSIKEFIEKGYILVKKKEQAIACGNKTVCFLFKNAMGLIELVEA